MRGPPEVPSTLSLLLISDDRTRAMVDTRRENRLGLHLGQEEGAGSQSDFIYSVQAPGEEKKLG